MNDQDTNRYELEAIVSFDDRGQLVIPKDLRKKFNLKAGDKFALISCAPSNMGCCDVPASDGSCCDGLGDNEVCCFTLVNTNQLKGLIGHFMGPAMAGMKGT